MTKLDQCEKQFSFLTGASYIWSAALDGRNRFMPAHAAVFIRNYSIGANPPP